MNFTTTKPELLSALNKVKGCLNTKGTIPILEHVKLSLTEGTLTITATDMDREAATQISVDSDSGNFETTVSGATLVAIVSKFPEKPVSFSVENDEATIKAGRSRYTLPTMSVEGFPCFQRAPLKHSADFGGDELASLIKSVAFAASTEEARYYLCGVYLNPVGENLNFVSTDGHRLVKRAVKAHESLAGAPSVILPTQGANEVVKLASGLENVTVAWSDTRLELTAGNTVFRTKLIDGTFPDYERVIPPEGPVSVTVDRQELLGAVERVSAIAGDKTRAIRLTASAGSLNVSSSYHDAAGHKTAEDEVDADGEGSIAIAFNGGYVADLLRHMTGETVTFRMSEPMNPVRVTGSDEGALAVLMPIRQ